MYSVLIIEDEKNVVDVVEAYLIKDGYSVYSSTNGKEGLTLFYKYSPDLLILDLMLPDMTGEDICKEIRRKSNVPIIMLTAKSAVEDRIMGLSIGADDYLVKPFSPKELVMRVRTVLRRTNNNEPLSDILSFNDEDLKIDVIHHKIFKKDVEVNLTPVEYKLLLLLVANPNKVYTRDELIEKVLGYDFEKRDRDLVKYLDDIYEGHESFSEDVLMNLMHQSMINNINISILGTDKNLLWKSHHSGMMGSKKYIENTYVINAEGKPDIYLVIGQHESALLTSGDIEFITSLQKGLIIASIIGFIFTTTLGIFLAQKLSKPILKLKDTTDLLRHGNLQARVNINSNTKELNELEDSINYLASTLEEQEVLRKRLTSDVSHELRTPLNVLQNQLEAIIDGIFEPTKQRLQICNNEVHRLTSLIKDLEKLTTLDQTDLIIDKAKHSVFEVIKPVIQQFEPSFQSKGLTVNFEVKSYPVTMLDKNKIIQVLFNLLSNAYKFTEPGGNINIKLTQDIKNVIITISDSGIGMSEQDIKNIFERFYRVERSRNRNTGGAGLGLSIVKSIINAHGGEIQVKSKLNVGTTFTILLPLK